MLNSPDGEGGVLQRYSKLLFARAVSDTGAETCEKAAREGLVLTVRTPRDHKLSGNLLVSEAFIQRENTS